jgi:hypothetical protein
MNTVKLTRIGNALGFVLPNTDALIFSNSDVLAHKLKLGDMLSVSRDDSCVNSYYIIFRSKGRIGGVNASETYRVFKKQTYKGHRILKLQSVFHQQKAPESNFVDDKLAEQMQIGRQFMLEYEETFYALAK